jgi:hypothetical protein
MPKKGHTEEQILVIGAFARKGRSKARAGGSYISISLEALW